MKRFVTYLYEYRNGDRIKNAGFIRVDIRNDRVNLEVCIKNIHVEGKQGVVYGLVKTEELLGIELGKMEFINGQNNTRFILDRKDVKESGYSADALYGIGLRFSDQIYLASCWNDAILDEIGKNAFAIWKKEDVKEEVKEDVNEDDDRQAAIVEDIPLTNEAELKVQEMSVSEVKEEEKKKSATYRKIDRNEIRSLPSGNWHMRENSFLKHGFLNYGYLILKKEIENENVWLGVPGFFEKPEMLMAMVYGFPNFEAIPKEVVELPMRKESVSYEIEKAPKVENGIFGAWYVPLKN